MRASGISWCAEEAGMAKTLIDVNEQYLAAAQAALHTETKKDTVNAALREAAALAARRRDLRRLASGGLPDREDDEVRRPAGRQWPPPWPTPAPWRPCAPLPWPRSSARWLAT